MHCVLYARVSTDKQAQKELSIPAQLAAMRQHAKSKGWKVLAEYVDEGESARSIKHPELQELIAICKEKKGVIPTSVAFFTCFGLISVHIRSPYEIVLRLSHVRINTQRVVSHFT